MKLAMLADPLFSDKVTGRLLRSGLILLAFASSANLVLEHAFDVRTWYKLQKTDGPFLVNYGFGTVRIGNTIVNLLHPYDTAITTTSICFRQNISAEFVKQIIRFSDGEVVSRAIKYYEKNETGCTEIDSLINVGNWPSGRYDIMREVILYNGYLHLSQHLPNVTFTVVNTLKNGPATPPVLNTPNPPNNPNVAGNPVTPPSTPGKK